MACRVLFFTDSQEFGGAEQTLVSLMAGLDRGCWEIGLFYHDSAGIIPLVNAARELNVVVKAVPPMPLGIRGARQAFSLAREIRLHKPVLFHANLTWPLSCKYGLFAAALAQIPVLIAAVHSFVDISYNRPTLAQLKLLSRMISRYVTVSYDMKDKIRQVFNIPEEKIQVIHNGIAIDSFIRKNIPGIVESSDSAGGNPVILTTARLVKEKGLEDLLRAAVRLPEATFLIAGEGPLHCSLEAQAKDLGVNQRVIFLGYVEDIGPLLQNCDLFVLSSYNEGLPLSILEAMAAGKAVVATQVGGIGEAVIDGKTGWLVPPADPDQLAVSIRTLLADPHLARQFGEAGRERVLRSFTVKKMVKRYSSTYETLLRIHGVLDEG